MTEVRLEISVPGTSQRAKIQVKDHGDGKWWLGPFSVPPESRGKGTGTRLLRILLTHLEFAGATELKTYAHASSSGDFAANQERLLAWYARMGFTPTACEYLLVYDFTKR